MGTVKYIISFLLIVFITLAIAEGYVQYTFSFSAAYPGVVLREASGEQLENLSRKAGVKIFAEEYRFDDIFTHRVNLYCSEGMKTVLRQRSMIQEGTCKSMLSGDTVISIFPLEEFEDQGKATVYYLHGSQEDMRRFCQETGGEPFETDGSPEAENQYVIYWIFALGAAALLTLYQIALLRREVLLRIISGQDLRQFILRHAAREFIFYGGCFLLFLLLFSLLSSPEYYLKNAGPWFFLLAVCNGSLYLLLLFTDYKKDMHIGVRARRVLKVSYVYKAVGIILTLAVITGCVRTISEAAPFYQPKEVFSHYKDYSYYQMNVDSDSGDGDRADRLSLKLYQEYLQKKKTFAMVELQDPGSYDANYIYADAGALPYLRGTIPELSKMDLREQTVYRISPANYEKTGNKQGDASQDVFETYYDGPYQMKNLAYEEDVKLIACDGSMGSVGVGTTKIKENPVILLNLITRDTGTVDPYILQSAMLEISDAEWEAFAEENGIRQEPIYKTNAWENYLNQWNVKKGSIVFSAALIVCMFLMEGILLYQILKYEFYVRGRELLLKKLHGYSFIRRYRGLLTLTLVCTAAGGGAVSVSNYFHFREPPGAMAAAVAGVLLVETALILYLIRKLEHRNLQRILKGGML